MDVWRLRRRGGGAEEARVGRGEKRGGGDGERRERRKGSRGQDRIAGWKGVGLRVDSKNHKGLFFGK